MDDNNTVVKKVSFDGRLHYFNNLAKLKSELNIAILCEDFISCYKILNLMVAEINDRVNNIEETKKKLDKLNSFIKPKFVNKFKEHIIDLINSINYEINLKASHLMLPVSEEVSGTDEDITF